MSRQATPAPKTPTPGATPLPLAESNFLSVSMSDVPFSVRRICIQRNSAFTLIELLVVIAIIGLLLAIIIPSLAKAKEKSRRVVCQSNLHQFSIGLNAYANSNKQMLPSGRSDASNDKHTPVLATKTRKERHSSIEVAGFKASGADGRWTW